MPASLRRRKEGRAIPYNFSRTLSAHLDGLPETAPIEIWFQDEARIGQKNGQVRQWAKRGTRPRQPADQRYDNAYLFRAICPARGVGAALALPYTDTNRDAKLGARWSGVMTLGMTRQNRGNQSWIKASDGGNSGLAARAHLPNSFRMPLTQLKLIFPRSWT